MKKYIIITSAVLLIILAYLFLEQSRTTTYGEILNTQIEQESVEEITIRYFHIWEDVSFSNIPDKDEDNLGYMETITITDMNDINRIMEESSDMKVKRGEGPLNADYRIRLISGQDFTTLYLNSNYMSDGEQHYRISGENELRDIIESLDYEWERTEF